MRSLVIGILTTIILYKSVSQVFIPFGYLPTLRFQVIANEQKTILGFKIFYHILET